MNDPYAALGITPNATDEEVTQAYRKMARHYHPDLNPGDKSAEQKMKEINCAYEAIREMRKNGGAGAGRTNGQNRSGSYYGSADGGFDYGANRSGQNGQYGQYGQNGQGENPFGDWYWSFGEFGGYGQRGQQQNQQREKPGQQSSLFRLVIRFLIVQSIIMFLLRACVYGGNSSGNNSGFNGQYYDNQTEAQSAENDAPAAPQQQV